MQKDDLSIVTAKQLITHFQKHGKISSTVRAPETVLVCYSPAAGYCAASYGPFEEGVPFSKVSIFACGTLGLLAGFGIGGSALAHQMEKLIALGTKRFILIGIAGSLTEDFSVGAHILCDRAYTKHDSLATLYDESADPYTYADSDLLYLWKSFLLDKEVCALQATTWSFPTLFLETPQRIRAARAMGCSVVEMEVATFYALAKSKGVSALALFVVSDMVLESGWVPEMKSDIAKNRAAELVDLAVSFCREYVHKNKEDAICALIKR